MPVDPNKPAPIKYERACRERIRAIRELIEKDAPPLIRLGETAYKEFLDWMKWAQRPTETTGAKGTIPFEGTFVCLNAQLKPDEMDCSRPEPP